LIERQHGVIARRQLLMLGVGPNAISRRVSSGRLHVLWRGVYAAGRPTVTVRGWWMAAVLACGNRAVLSHASAGALWGMLVMNTGNQGLKPRRSLVHISIPADRVCRRGGIRVHRRGALAACDLTRREGIPVTSPRQTLIDLATLLQPSQLEAAVNAADRLDLIDPELLRVAVQERSGMDGAGALRKVLDRRSFGLTDSELERRFLRLVVRSRLPAPKTQQIVEGFRVDFFWPESRLVVETDGLRYHRTPGQQAKDRRRDQVLVASGLTVLRFTHAQVVYEPQQVRTLLRAILISKD
jgi:very-short-patch-repair endonuclease